MKDKRTKRDTRICPNCNHSIYSETLAVCPYCYTKISAEITGEQSVADLSDYKAGNSAQTFLSIISAIAVLAGIIIVAAIFITNNMVYASEIGMLLLMGGGASLWIWYVKSRMLGEMAYNIQVSTQINLNIWKHLQDNAKPLSNEDVLKKREGHLSRIYSLHDELDTLKSDESILELRREIKETKAELDEIGSIHVFKKGSLEDRLNSLKDKYVKTLKYLGEDKEKEIIRCYEELKKLPVPNQENQ